MGRVERILRYEGFIIVGILIVFGTLIKLFGYVNFSSDWFWFLAGAGLIIEGSISMIKERKFNKKYKIIERENL